MSSISSCHLLTGRRAGVSLSIPGRFAAWFRITFAVFHLKIRILDLCLVGQRLVFLSSEPAFHQH